MDDAALMGVIERINDLSRDGRRLVERQGPLSDLLCQRRPFHELHDEVVVTHVVKRADVGMIERGDDLRFAGESLAESFRRDLDGGLTRQAGILRPIHLPHATHADLGSNLVRAEPGTWGKRHCAGDSTVRSCSITNGVYCFEAGASACLRALPLRRGTSTNAQSRHSLLRATNASHFSGGGCLAWPNSRFVGKGERRWPAQPKPRAKRAFGEGWRARQDSNLRAAA